MKVTVCDNNIESRRNIIKLLKQYSENNEVEMTITEYDNEQQTVSHTNKNQEGVEFSFVEGEVTLFPQDIIYVENEKHRQIFHTCLGDFSIYWKLSEIERKLQAYNFLRIHQSFLVNMSYVRRLSGYLLTLKNGIQLSVPKARYAKVKEQFLEYKGKSE